MSTNSHVQGLSLAEPQSSHLLDVLGKVVRSEDALVAISHFTLPDNPNDTEMPSTKRVKTDVTDGCVVLSRLEELRRCLEDPSSKAVPDPSLDADSAREDVLRAAVITAGQRLDQLGTEVRSLRFRLKQSQREVATLKAEHTVTTEKETSIIPEKPLISRPVLQPAAQPVAAPKTEVNDEALAKEVEVLKLQLQSRQEAVAEAEAETAHLREELERVKQSCAQRVADSASRERKAIWEMEAERRRNGTLDSVNREEGKRAERERSRCEVAIASMESQLKDADKRLKEEKERYHKKMETFEKEMKKIRAERDGFERKLKRHKLFADVLATMEGTIEKLTKVLSSTSEGSDASSREKVLRQQVTDMSTSLMELNTTIHKTQKLVAFGDKKNDQLQTEFLAQQKQIEMQKGEMEQDRETLREVKEQLNEANEEIARLRHANEALEKAAQGLADEVNGLRAEVMDMTASDDSYQSKWQRETAENERLKSHMLELNKEVTALRMSVKKERIRFERRLMASRSEEEKEVLELMQEEMRRYRAELMCPVCKVKPKDCILCKCQHIFCRDCVEERISVCVMIGSYL